MSAASGTLAAVRKVAAAAKIEGKMGSASNLRWAVVASLAASLAAPALAVDGAADPIPGVRDGMDAPQGHWLNWTDYNMARRASVPGKWQGEVALEGNTASPGRFGASPDAGVTGRLGLGYGLSAELSASRSTSGDYRPGIGLKYQLKASPTGLNLAVMGLFRPEGFNEPEGEVELHLIGGYRQGKGEVTLNAVAGADPDFKDADVEGKLAAGYRVAQSVLIGAEARTRNGLGSKVEGWGRHEHIAGALAQIDLGKFTLSGLAGAGTYQATTGADYKSGGYLLARLGYRF